MSWPVMMQEYSEKEGRSRMTLSLPSKWLARAGQTIAEVLGNRLENGGQWGFQDSW